MKRIYLLLTMLLVVLIGVARTDSRTQTPGSAARGAYIANRVSLCTDCHTSRLVTGQIDRKRLLSGATILLKPTVYVPKWATKAPNLTPASSLAKWTNAQQVRFLMTGKDPSGKFADMPMPQYRFDRADAAAIAVYLRSIPAVK